jgi:hypothetical protein
MCCIDLDDTDLTSRTTTALLVAGRLLLPIRNFAVNRAVFDLAFLILKSGTNAELTTVFFLYSLIAVTLMHTNAALLITLGPFRPLREFAVDWAWNDLAFLTLLLRSFACLASMLVLHVLATCPFGLTNATSGTAHGPTRPCLPFAIDWARILVTGYLS